MKIVQFNGEYLHVCDATNLIYFRLLDESEVSKYRAWARTQPAGVKVNPLWHPVVQDELLISGCGEEWGV
jgi:hypothetical protein